jgi:hypothetical protein
MSKDEKKPSELYPRVAKSETKLKGLIGEFINVGKAMFPGDVGAVYKTDIFLFGVLNRSVNLVDAILVLTESWNFVAAGPLVRVHLDTLLRMSYLRATKDPENFAMEILRGKQVNKIRDEEGEELTDARLRYYAKKVFQQIDEVYRETSKLVHFSNKHVFTCITKVNDTGEFEAFIGKGSRKWQERDILSLLECCVAITEAILAISRGWVLEKAQICNQKDKLK